MGTAEGKSIFFKNKSLPKLDKHGLHSEMHITKTYLYNFDPLKPHFYIVKPGFTVYIIFLISAQKHRLWVLVSTLEPRHSISYKITFSLNQDPYQHANPGSLFSLDMTLCGSPRIQSAFKRICETLITLCECAAKLSPLWAVI